MKDLIALLRKKTTPLFHWIIDYALQLTEIGKQKRTEINTPAPRNREIMTGNIKRPRLEQLLRLLSKLHTCIHNSIYARYVWTNFLVESAQIIARVQSCRDGGRRMSIRRNAEELQDMLNELNSWQDVILDFLTASPMLSMYALTTYTGSWTFPPADLKSCFSLLLSSANMAISL